MQTYRNDDLVFDVIDRGAETGEPVVLLHGFPQGMHAWDGVSDVLAARGLRALAPDQRGYSPGARPLGRRSYRLHLLVEDVMALLDAAGMDRAHIVGHDWGAIVAWAMAQQCPDRLASLVTVSVPHPAAFRRALYTSPQLLRSWYMFVFQLPRVPELAMTAGPNASRRALKSLTRTGLPAAAAQAYVDRMTDREALTAMVNWYRAIPFMDWRRSGDPVDVPTLMVWSLGDKFLHRRGAEETGRFCRGPYRLEVIEGGSHWLPETHSELLGQLIANHVVANTP
ncbi:MAG: alpha/beta fold hydrolase [Acidimicrobiales bacterium]